MADHVLKMATQGQKEELGFTLNITKVEGFEQR